MFSGYHILPFRRYAGPVMGMEAYTAYPTSWLGTLLTCVALTWLFYRGYQVLAKPLDELITLLGLEVPAEPIVTLAGIRADGVILHWKPSAQRSAVEKYQIHVNGISVGEVSHHDTSVMVTGLKPEHFYIIRVVAVSAVKFQSASTPIRLRTRPANSHDYFNPPDASSDQEHPIDDRAVPTVQAYKAFLETGPPSQAPPAITREHSGSISQLRRLAPGRRQSPTTSGTDQQYGQDSNSAEIEESVQQLTAKLDSLRRENEETEKAVADEDSEYESSKLALINERDELQQSLKRRQDASADLKKEIAILSRDNSMAQNKKVAQTRLLEQKQNEKKKFKDDIVRRRKQIGEMREAVGTMGEAKEEYRESTKQKLQELRQQHSSEQQANKTLEESIREIGTQIKALEEEKRRLESEAEAEKSLGQDEVDEVSEQTQWQQRYAQLQAQYTAAWNEIQTAQASLALSQQYLDTLRQRRASQTHPFTSMSTVEGPPARINSQRRRRTGSIRNETGSLSGGVFPMSSGPPYNSSISSISPSFSSASPFFNINNGMTLPSMMQQSDLQPAEIEQLTCGALMSPSHAADLLPSDLFDGQSGLADEVRGRSDGIVGGLPSTSGVLPGLGAIPGLGAPHTLDQQAQGPSSPISLHSQSPSAFASPQESSSHLVLHHGADNVDSDRRSVRSTTSSLRATSGSALHGGTRFANIFSLHRQRGKTLSEDGPMLGSLKPSQSRSMPRNDPVDQDPIGTRRRRGSESGGLLERMFSQGSGSSAKAYEANAQASPEAGRKRWLFGSKTEPWSSLVGSDRASSPRPASTNSSENNVFPRPSTESQTRFGWPIDHPGQKHSPLTAEWAPGPTATSWSRHPSRRPSASYGTSLSLPHTEALVEVDSPDLEPVRVSPTQAPIGTRPQVLQVQSPSTPPRLNPAAKDFKSSSFNFFSRDKKGEKSAEKGKGKGKERLAALEVSVADITKETSPPTSRRSKDARSTSTAAESIGDSRESLDRSASHTPSECFTPSGNGKESFMQKLTRKSSSGKFNFPSFSKDKGGLFSSSRKASEIETPDETDEDVGGGQLQLGKGGADSVGGSPQVGSVKENRVSGLSWSSLKKLGKKGDKTPSNNDSMTSETGDEGDEEEDEDES